MEELLSFLPSPQISTGSFHTIVLTPTGQLYGCGDNEEGQLGFILNSRHSNRLKRIPVAQTIGSVFAGFKQTFIVTIGGRLLASGYNRYGQLGTGDNEHRSQFVPIDPIKPVKFVSTWMTHTALITTEGQLYTCGFNYWGELGLGDEIDRNTFVEVDLPDLIVETAVVANTYTLLITTKDLSYTCGRDIWSLSLYVDVNNLLRFVPINYLPPIKAISIRNSSIGFITRANQLFMYRSNEFDQLRIGTIDSLNTHFDHIPTDTPVRSVAVNGRSTAVIDDHAELFMCGSNEDGQFGVEEPKQSAYFIQVDVDVASVVLGFNYTVILTTDERIYATGRNERGQLGVGDTRSRHQFTEMIKD